MDSCKTVAQLWFEFHIHGKYPDLGLNQEDVPKYVEDPLINSQTIRNNLEASSGESRH